MKRLISFLLRYTPRPLLQRVQGAGAMIMGLFYAGDRVLCPICEHRYRSFMPYGRTPRDNALCPSCLSLERHRLIWLYLQKTPFFSQPLNVLHMAPESCFIPRFIRSHGARYIAADIESPLAAVKMDIHHISFPDNAFDVTLCNHVLEHVDDDVAALREIFRTLKPNGWAILQVPFYSPIPKLTLEDPLIIDQREREKAFGQRDHVRKYGEDYPLRLEQAGFVVEARRVADLFSNDEMVLYGLDAQETLYIGRKMPV